MKFSTTKKLALLLLVALALRLAAGVWWQSRTGPGFYFGDSESYWSLGRAVAQGEPYRYGDANSRVFRTPGYPILLSPIFLIGGDEPSVFWARALGAVFGTLSVAGTWWLARRLFGPAAGWTAGIITAFYPEAIATSVFVLSEAPFCPLMLANLALWILAWQTDSWRRATWLAVAAGAVGGAATLVRPSWLLFLPFAVVIGLVFGHRNIFWYKKCPDQNSLPGTGETPVAPKRGPRGRGRHLLLGLGMTIGMVLVMTPWWIRNARVVGRFVPTTLEVGASLYDGLNPNATGGSDMAFVNKFYFKERKYPTATHEPLEVRMNRQMRREALSWAKECPGWVIHLAKIKFLKMWGLWASEKSLTSWPLRLLIMLTYVPVLLLGILCVAKTIRRGWPYWLCWLPAIYFTLLHIVFVSSIRYREPAMLGLIVLAAGMIAVWRGEDSTKEGYAR